MAAVDNIEETYVDLDANIGIEEIDAVPVIEEQPEETILKEEIIVKIEAKVEI